MKRATKKVVSGTLVFIFFITAISGVLAYFFNKDFKNKVNDVLNIKQEEVVDVPETENQSSADKETIANLQQQVEDNAETIAKLQNQIIEKEDQLEILNAELEAAQKDNVKNEELIKNLNSQKQVLENDIEALRFEMESLSKNNTTIVEESALIKSLSSYSIDLGEAFEVESIYNTYLKNNETDYYVTKYGTSFKEKLNVSFDKISADTTYWLSHDGNKIFFLLDDNTLIAYENESGNFNKILDFKLNLEVEKISAFDDFVFIFTKESPCVYAYKIVDNSLVQCNLDLSSFEKLSVLNTFTLIDIVQGKDGTFMLGFVVPNGELTDAYTLYLTFDSESNSFIYDSYVSTENEYKFIYMLPFHKNNFSDAQIIYLQPGESSSACRRAVHNIDKTSSSGYNVTAYYYTYATTNITVKNRAVICEKTLNPITWVYFYPQIYRYQIPQFAEAEKNYISTNLLYLFQKLPDSTYRAYSLAGYENVQSISLPEDLDQSKIINIEAFEDVVLFFLNDGTIEVYNFNTDRIVIENVVSKKTDYIVNYKKVVTIEEKLNYIESSNNAYSTFLENLDTSSLTTYVFDNSVIYVQTKTDITFLYIKTKYSFSNPLKGTLNNFNYSSSDGSLEFDYNSELGNVHYKYKNLTLTEVTT